MGMGGVEMKVAVTGGHGCNLSSCRSLVALTMLVTVTVTLRLLTIDLTCLHVHYWQEAGIKITHGSLRHAIFWVSMAIYADSQTKKPQNPQFWPIFGPVYTNPLPDFHKVCTVYPYWRSTSYINLAQIGSYS